MFQQIVDYFARNHAVRKVAENPAIAAELLLMIKVLFADHYCTPQETEAFARIAEEKFGIERQALPAVVKYLRDFSYETSTGQAALIFAELEPKQRAELIQVLMQIAVADHIVDLREVAMIERVAAIIGITPTEIEDLRRMTDKVQQKG